MNFNKVGIIGAMKEEVDGLISILSNANMKSVAGLDFYEGYIGAKHVVLVCCGIAKVNAAMCTQILISEFGVDSIINTGVAGGIDDCINVGDVVISTDAIQYDVDASAAGDPKGTIPRMKTSVFTANKELVDLAYDTYIKVNDFFDDELKKDNICRTYNFNKNPNIYKGRIITGDKFVADKGTKNMLKKNFGGYCCEMEGGSIAHVAYCNNIPFVIIRSISDNADNEASITFDEFLHISTEISKKVTTMMIKSM